MTTNQSAAAVAESLATIAARLRQLGDDDPSRLYVTLSIVPLGDAEQAKVVDRVAAAVCGRPGEPREMPSGAWHHSANHTVGPVHIATMCALKSPADALREDNERLRAELAAARCGREPEPTA